MHRQASDAPEAQRHRSDLLAVQPRHLVRQAPAAHVPEAQRAVKVPRRQLGAVGAQRQRLAAAVAHQGAQAVAALQAPQLQRR